MEQINILILEDSDSDYKDIHLTSIESFNKTNNSNKVRVTDHRARTVEDAGKLLNSEISFHSAIVDLKLNQERTADEGKGNELVGLILDKYRIPIFVYSKNTTLLDPKFEDRRGVFFNTYNKGNKNFVDILNEIKNINNTGIVEILGKRGHIENVLDKIFWRHISTSLGNWFDVTKDKNEKMLLRHVSEYILQYLGFDESTGEYEQFHQAEFYSIPPVLDKLSTGDILLKNGSEEHFVVLTPSCDLAHAGKTKVVLIVKIIPNSNGLILTLISSIKKLKSQQEIPDKKKEYDKVKADLSNLICNNYSPKYYYLPSTKEIVGGLINFQEITTVKKDLIDSSISEYKRIASISSSFIKDIVAKFSNYYSRQGAPDLNKEDILAKLLD